ncbi:MAG: hypothetical protein ACR2JW_14095 [Thermomicrobiales bacterium]
MADDSGGDNPDQGDERLSQHPVDALIRDLIRTRRPASDDEIVQIVDRMASTPFNQQIVSVPVDYRGLTYQGHTLSNRENVWLLHLFQRVVDEQQWTEGTDRHEYLSDLRRAVRHFAARLCVYQRRGGNLASILAPNTMPITRRGIGSLPFVFIIYSADRGRIVSGYQASGVDTISIPEDAQWLK